jgi:hypothetical protein
MTAKAAMPFRFMGPATKICRQNLPPGLPPILPQNLPQSLPVACPLAVLTLNDGTGRDERKGQ